MFGCVALLSGDDFLSGIAGVGLLWLGLSLGEEIDLAGDVAEGVDFVENGVGCLGLGRSGMFLEPIELLGLMELNLGVDVKQVITKGVHFGLNLRKLLFKLVILIAVVTICSNDFDCIEELRKLVF